MNKRIQKKLTKQYCIWLDYEIGFSGHGTTMLDRKPKFPKPNMNKNQARRKIKRVLDADGDKWRQAKQDAYRRACIEVLGEDPETDWGYNE